MQLGDVEQNLLVVILHPSDSVNTLGNDPLILSQHLAWCAHTLSPGGYILYVKAMIDILLLSAKILISKECTGGDKKKILYKLIQNTNIKVSGC